MELIRVLAGGAVIVGVYVEEGAGAVVAGGGSDEAAGVGSEAGETVIVGVRVGVAGGRPLPGDGASLSMKSEASPVSFPAGCLSRE